MKLFINKKLFDHTGEVIKADGSANSPAAKLGEICTKALLAETQQDQNADFAVKMRKWNIARSISKAIAEDGADDNFVELPVEDLDLIKKRIGTVYGTGIVGPAINALES